MLTWRQAMQQALYGPEGFYVRADDGPRAHFRTSVHASAQFAAAVVSLLRLVDGALGHPTRLDLVDVGAGRGELLTAVEALLRSVDDPTALDSRLLLVAVEQAARPEHLSARVTWTSDLPDGVTGLLLANEWLDNVPLDVVQWDGTGWRLVLVDPADGHEELGPPPSRQDAAWLHRWWPIGDPVAGDRAEVGSTRDAAWAVAVTTLRAGAAVAIDYCHARDERTAGRWSTGTLAGFRQGRAAVPVPDGSCDLTAHVALDACAHAGRVAGADAGRLTTQRRALTELGLSGRRPATERAGTDPTGYLADLARASEVAELLDPSGLGGFGWLTQTRGISLSTLSLV